MRITTIEIGEMDLERLIKLLNAIAAPWTENGDRITVRVRMEMFVEDKPNPAADKDNTPQE